MASITKTYGSLTPTSLNGTTLSGSLQYSGVVNLETNGEEGVEIFIDFAPNASGTEGIQIAVHGNDETNTDNLPRAAFDIPHPGDATHQYKSIVLDRVSRFQVSAVEVDTESNHGTITVKYKAWSWASA